MDPIGALAVFQLPHRHQSIMVVPLLLLLPIISAERIGWIATPGIDAPIRSPCRLLPFGFGRQPLSGPLAIVVRIRPIDIDNRALLMKRLVHSRPLRRWVYTGSVQKLRILPDRY